MADIDLDLQKSLKLAKGKEMFFAFIPKGAEGELIVSKKKIPPKEIAALKKEIGGGQPILGKCEGPLDAMVFKVAKMSATLAPAIKKVAKKLTGLTVNPEIMLASEADLEDEGKEDEDEDKKTPEKKEEKPDVDDVVAPPEEPDAPPEQADLDWKPWYAARDNAIKELKALAGKVASTKHASAAEVLKELNGIIKKLPSDPNPDKLDDLAKLIESDDGISAAEEAPAHFHKVDIRKPMLDAIAALKSARDSQPVA